MLPFALLLGGWLVFPVALWLRSPGLRTHSGSPANPGEAESPRVSVIIATRESPESLQARVSNLLESNYRIDRLEVVIAVDHRSAFSLEQYNTLGRGNVVVVPGDEPGGKACALNAGVRSSRSEVLVFADSAQVFAPDAVAQLVGMISGPTYAVASGSLRSHQYEGKPSLLGLFWRYEEFIRRMEARRHSLVAVTGAIYALRRTAWMPLPPGTICDDLYVPLRAIRNGLRVGHADKAFAYESRVFNADQEFRRKVRTQTGLIQFCLDERWILSPINNPVWIQFLCHKIIRLATPYLLLASLLCCLALSYVWYPEVTVRVGIAGLLTLGSLLVIGRVYAPAARIAKSARSAILLLTAPLVASARAIRGDWSNW